MDDPVTDRVVDLPPNEPGTDPKADESGTTGIDVVLCDLDGVVWLAHEPIVGSVEAIAALRAGGRRVLFVTNNSAARIADQEATLEKIGVPAHGDVVSSAMAAGRLIRSGERVLVTGGPGIVEAVERAGGHAVVNDDTYEAREGSPGFDVVVAGLDRRFDYERLAAATTAVLGGARLVGTNSDATYPTPAGLEPGGGSIVAAIAWASGAVPVFSGKPEEPMARAVAAAIGQGDRIFDPKRTVMIGDRPETDGAMAETLGCRFVLVRSGVTGRDAVRDAGPDGVRVDVDVANLAAFADLVLQSDSARHEQ